MREIGMAILTGLFVLVAGCSKSDDKSAKLSVRLTDAPAAYDEVLIDVQDVRINVSATDDDSGWQSLTDVNKGVYNLLDFTNGVDTLLAEQELPGGTISQMRLVLGTNNELKIGDQYFPLQTPSGQQSGLKFNIHATLAEGVTYKLWIDFDAGRSIVAKGNGTYSLKPVIRTFTEATSGAIKGVISPVEAKSHVMAISTANDTIGTYTDETTGAFLLRGVEEGVYKVKFDPVDGFSDKEFENVQVELGATTDLGQIELESEQAE